MKEVWVCRCGSIHESEDQIKQCHCTFDGYSHRYECLNCGRIYKNPIICCSLLSVVPYYLIKPLKKSTHD